MDVVTTNSSEGSFSILTAGSDGALRKFEYDIAQDRLELSEESYPHEKFAFLKIALCEGKVQNHSCFEQSKSFIG